jgi:UDP-3-O-[3-hydroxymyristoyl] glucosamine N-acyltransferase
MKLSRNFSLSEFAAIIQAKFIGDADHQITGISEIHTVEAGDLTFVDHPKYYNKALNSKATTILINKEVDCPEGKGLLISDDPFADYVKLFGNSGASRLQQHESALRHKLAKER